MKRTRSVKPNQVLADHGDWLEIDVSTENCPSAILKIDKPDWAKIMSLGRGRVYAVATVWTRYAFFMENRRPKGVHRDILAPPAHLHVDHIDHDGLNNRRCNIRVATNAENMRNCLKSKANKSGATGVSWFPRDGKWVAKIKKNYRQIHLGYFTKLEDAVAARKAAEIEHFGEFAYRGDK